MKFIKVYTNFRRAMSCLKDDEKGRLFDAMLEYAETGEEPEFVGNEQFLWGSVLNMFEAMELFNEKQRTNGAKGGRPSKPKETQQNPNNPEEPNESQITLKEKKRKEKKEKEMDIYMVNRFDEFWSIYPKKVSKQAALKAWNHLKPSNELIETILDDVRMRSNSQSWTKDNGQFIPYPSTYLNGHRWEDAIPGTSNVWQELFDEFGEEDDDKKRNITDAVPYQDPVSAQEWF